MNPEPIARVAHAITKSFRNSSNDKKRKKNNSIIWIVLAFVIIFCFPVIAITSGIQMLQDRISDLFDWTDFYSGLFDFSEDDIDAAFERWFQTDYPRLQQYNDGDYPSLNMAYGLSFYYQAINSRSVFDDYDDFMTFFLTDEREKCITAFEEITGIEVPENQSTEIASLGDNLEESTEPDGMISFIIDTNYSGGRLADAPENTYYTGSDSRAAQIWNQAFSIGGGNPFYYIAINGGWSPRQCTTFAWYRFYQYYGYDCGARSDGRNFAYYVVNSHPDKFSLKYYPAAGSIVSFPPTKSNSHGHVGFVEKVEGNYLWYSEGNYDGGGIRLNTKISITSLTKAKCGDSWCIAYAVPK